MARRMRSSLLLLAAAAVIPWKARAAEVTRAVSGVGDAQRPEVVVSLSWLHESHSAAVKREVESSLTDRGIGLTRDLRFTQSRDLLALRAETGALWDLSVHLEAPLVLTDSRHLEFDGESSSSSSTMLRDGILPGYGQLTSPDRTVFRGPKRSGLEFLGVGLTWAVMRQDRDDSKPTWLLSFDTRWSIGGAMGFDRLNPDANTSVGLGYHQLVWSTWLSRRTRHIEPYFGVWYMLPVRSSSGPFKNYPDGAPTSGPQQRVGLSFGFEHVAWEEPVKKHRFSFEVRGRGVLFFRGRNFTEIWEPLSGASTCTATSTADCRPGIDDGGAFPGVSQVDSYASFGADAGMNLRIGQHVRVRGLVGMTGAQSHLITGASPGRDLDGDGAVTFAGEKNPTYRQTIDLPGRRFRVEESRFWNLLLDVAVSY